jgi:hypothetical protein
VRPPGILGSADQRNSLRKGTDDMFTHPYIAKIVARERYERKLQDADAWRLSQTLRKNRPGTPLRAAYRALCRLGARGWRPQRLIEQH